MCTKCQGYYLISAIATWAFFALLLSILNATNALLNAVWLTIFACIAVSCCPVCNPKVAECCTAKPIKKKK